MTASGADAMIGAMETVVLPDRERLAELCRRWKIRNLFLFGSVARGEARPDSDVDLLVEFEPDRPSTVRFFLDARADFERAFGRPVDLVQDRLVTNPYRRASIGRDKKLLYAA